LLIGIIVGPDRILGLDVKEAMTMDGLYAFPAPEITIAAHAETIRRVGSQALAREKESLDSQNPRPTIYYSADIASRIGGQMLSVPPEMDPKQAEIYAREAALLRGAIAEVTEAAAEIVTLPTAQIPESLAA
jgi:hypothetical protein